MNSFDITSLEKLNATKMPYGKYRGISLLDLPEPYVIWYYENNISQNELGKLFSELYEIKVNGLESMVKKILREAHLII